MNTTALPQVPARSPAAAGADQGAHPWRVLLVDPDELTHVTLGHTLRGVQIQARGVELTAVSSVSEAIEQLEQCRDFALILIEVVFTPTHRGATLVQYIREVCQMRDARILLHTTCPWLAPPRDFLTRYDISDFRAKAEQDFSRLLGSISAALRSYEQLQVIAQSRRGLDLIVHAAAELTGQRGLQQFAEGVLTQIAALLRLPLDGVVCVKAGSPQAGERAEARIVAAAGALSVCLGRSLESLPSDEMLRALRQTLDRREHQFLEGATVLYMGANDHAAAVYLRSSRRLRPLDQQLLEVFCTNLSASFAKLNLIEELNFLAFHDPLTRLGNRAWLSLRLEAACKRGLAQRLMLLDVRRFADVNNALGFEVGNALLCAVAQRLQERLGASCELARLSGDVFALLGPADALPHELPGEMFAAALMVAGQPMTVDFAMACYELGEPCDCTPALALRRASTALITAKSRAVRGVVCFDAGMEEQARKRLELARRLRIDFEAGRLALFYQPQVCLRTGRVMGLEALLRWPDGQRGFVTSPDQFVPLAEYSGLIGEVGAWALQQAAADWAVLRHEPNAPQRIGVNVSMAQFRSDELIAQVRQALAQHQLPAGALELEITESIAMDEPAHVRALLAELRALGVRIAVDDFGTGYSSLSQLKSLPVDTLKVDRSFVSQIGQGDGDIYAETIVGLGRRLGLELVAEGVETEDQERFLRALGCQLAQGWRYAPAMPLGDLQQWLRQREGRAHKTPGEEWAGH